MKESELYVIACVMFNTMDGEIFNTVIQRYIGDKKKDVAKLMMYASKLGVEKKARRVVGIWL